MELKSFNNVDKAMKKNSTLQKANTVIETPEVSYTVDKKQKKLINKPFAWNIGY